jgi:hypothetical protein
MVCEHLRELVSGSNPYQSKLFAANSEEASFSTNTEEL